MFRNWIILNVVRKSPNLDCVQLISDLGDPSIFCNCDQEIFVYQQPASKQQDRHKTAPDNDI